MCCISMNARSARAGFTTAIQERLERIKKRKLKEGLSEKLLAIGRETAPLFPKGFKSTDIDELLYDEHGLPK